jgi:EAL domain-containing protein (putative c-di-GMP-specific phosphodiesterase class I)
MPRVAGADEVEAPGRLLLVDDDDIARRSIARLLTKVGYVVLHARDGLEGLRVLAAEEVDAVISDIHMPQMTGVEMLRTLRASGATTPVVLLTGQADVPTAAAAVEYRAVRYLSKPVEAHVLWDAAREAATIGKEAQRSRRAAAALAEEQQRERERQVAMQAALDEAIDNLWIAFQPIVVEPGGRAYGYETLMRSHGPRLRFPLDILDVAEKLNRIHDLGRAVRARIAESVTVLSEQQAVFVNIHPDDLHDETLYDPDAPLSQVAHRVVLEITERASLNTVSELSERIAKLRDMGFRIAVDDLGAGYAGLMAIAQLEPDVVKLDMSLVRDIDRKPTKQSLVGGMVVIAKQLGALVIAEGVETSAERDALAELGCELMQGYFFARPLPISEALALAS